MNNINSNQNESKINKNITNNSNTKNQSNNKSINTNQNDKTLNTNNKYFIYIKPILLLLEKAEQIISIINLPSSSIDKYNQLKEISFKKCGLEFKPLIKNNDLIKNFQKENNNIEQKTIKLNNIEKEFSIIKNKLIDLIFGFIQSFDFNNKDNKSKISCFNEFNNNCNLLKEEINSVIKEGNINIDVENNSINKEEKEIINEKEKLLNYIIQAQQNIKSVLCENDKKFNELKEIFLIQNSKIEYLNKYIKNIDELISPIWNKYFNNELDWFDPNKIVDNFEMKTYTKSYFLLNFMNQLFTDNKNLMEALTEMEKKKNEAYNILKMPYVRKVIEKNEIIKNIDNLFRKLKENKEKNKNLDLNKLIKNGKELINTIKETIIDDPKGENLILNSDNNDIEMINNYNDEMNLFLGKLMNGIQNVLNKVDISIKKDELIESMLKTNFSKNKNINTDNSIINMNNTISNINTSQANINNTINNGFISKDLSFISTFNENNSKMLNNTFQVYKKKTNHISGSNIIISNKNEIENRKEKFGIINKNKNEESKNVNNNKNKNNIVNNINKNKNEKTMINNEDDEMNNEEINEEKNITVKDIGNDIPDENNIEINKKNNMQTLKEKINDKTDNNFDEGIEVLKNMVLEDFKSRINEENDNYE